MLETTLVWAVTVFGFLERWVQLGVSLYVFAVFQAACLVRMHTLYLHRNAREECVRVHVCLCVHICECVGCVCQTHKETQRRMEGEETAGDMVG